MATSHPLPELDVDEVVLAQDQKHKQLLGELLTSPKKLTHPPVQTDRSGAYLDPETHLTALPHKELMHEIEAGAALHHVEVGEIHDASAPVVDKDVVIHPNKHAELLEEVKAVAAQHEPHMAKPWLDDTSVSGPPLKHVETQDKTDLKHVMAS